MSQTLISYIVLLILISNISSFSPVKVYPNFYADRREIRADHARSNGKFSGIYLFVNLQNPLKCYVGQSSNILGRMNNYLNPAFLESKKNSNSAFNQALLTHGCSGFSLFILEYVEPAQLNERELLWISLLDPYYNVLPGGSLSSTGFQHSEETKDLLRQQRLGTTHSQETKDLISQSTSGSNNPFFGRTHSKLSLLAISVTKSLGPVLIYSVFGVLLLSVSSVKMLSKLVRSSSDSINKAIKTSSLFRGGWFFTRTPKTPGDSPIITDQTSEEANALYAQIIATKDAKPVYLFSADRKFIREYVSVMACAADINVSLEEITKQMSTNDGKLGDYIISTTRHLK